MKIESKHEIINNNSVTIFEFLSDLSNYQELFPKDKIENWIATDEYCTCKINGLSDIGLKKAATTPSSLIYLDSYGKSPFKFTLNIFLTEKGENETEVYLVFDGDINPFMKMMLEKPLTTFFNNIAYRLKEKYS